MNKESSGEIKTDLIATITNKLSYGQFSYLRKRHSGGTH